MIQDEFRKKVANIFLTISPITAARYVRKNITHKKINEYGFYEISQKMNINPWSILSDSSLFAWDNILKKWAIFEDLALPSNIRYLFGLYEIAELFKYESSLTEPPKESFEYYGFIERDTDSYIFAMETCMPINDVKKYIKENLTVDDIMHIFHVYRDFVSEWLEWNNIFTVQ